MKGNQARRYDARIHRFHGAEAWPLISRDAQAAIGAIALELVSAWWAQEQGAVPDMPDKYLRAGEAAEPSLLEALRETVTLALTTARLDGPDGYPRIPSILGEVCNVCGCSQHDACQGGCAWAGDHLCTACVPKREGAAP